MHQFGLSDSTQVVEEQDIGGLAGFKAPDLILDDGHRRYYIEVASPKNVINRLSEISLFRELLKAEKKYKNGDLFVILFKNASDRAWDIAEKIDVKMVRAPFDLKLSNLETPATPAKVKLTTEKSWAVIYYLITRGPASMYQVSKDTNVSYGWVHNVVTSLIDTGIASKGFDTVKINDLNKLFNGIAWERPFESLKIAEVTVDFETSYSAAKEISGNLKAHGIPFAFNSTTAGGLYTGRVIRHDTTYLYLDKDRLESFEDTFSSKSGSGIKVKIYSPDRNMFSQSRNVEGVTVTSPELTLLDLACTGYGNMELTKAMAGYYETE